MVLEGDSVLLSGAGHGAGQLDRDRLLFALSRGVEELTRKESDLLSCKSSSSSAASWFRAKDDILAAFQSIRATIDKWDQECNKQLDKLKIEQEKKYKTQLINISKSKARLSSMVEGMAEKDPLPKQEPILELLKQWETLIQVELQVLKEPFTPLEIVTSKGKLAEHLIAGSKWTDLLSFKLKEEPIDRVEMTLVSKKEDIKLNSNVSVRFTSAVDTITLTPEKIKCRVYYDGKFGKQLNIPILSQKSIHPHCFIFSFNANIRGTYAIYGSFNHGSLPSSPIIFNIGDDQQDQVACSTPNLDSPTDVVVENVKEIKFNFKPRDLDDVDNVTEEEEGESFKKKNASFNHAEPPKPSLKSTFPPPLKLATKWEKMEKLNEFPPESPSGDNDPPPMSAPPVGLKKCFSEISSGSKTGMTNLRKHKLRIYNLNSEAPTSDSNNEKAESSISSIDTNTNDPPFLKSKLNPRPKIMISNNKPPPPMPSDLNFKPLPSNIKMEILKDSIPNISPIQHRPLRTKSPKKNSKENLLNYLTTNSSGKPASLKAKNVFQLTVSRPIGLTLLPISKNIVVGCTGDHTVKIFDPKGNFIKKANPKRPFKRPSDMTSLPDGRFAVRDDKGIMLFDEEGEFYSDISSLFDRRCYGLATDGKGLLITVTTSRKPPKSTNAVFIDIETKSIYETIELCDVISDNEKSMCRFIHFRNKSLYIVDLGLDVIYMLNTETKRVTKFGQHGKSYGNFNDPAGIVTDTFGNAIIVDSGNNRIQVFDKSRQFVAKVETDKGLKRPSGILFDPEKMELFVLNLHYDNLTKYKIVKG